MNSEDLIQITDQLLYEDTGRHLTHLQSQILVGVIDRQSYRVIAIAHDCTEGHIRDVAYKLWKQLAKTLNEPVSKVNIVAILKRTYWSLLNAKIDNKKLEYGIENFQPVSKCINPKRSHAEIISKLTQIGLNPDQVHDVLEFLVTSELISPQYVGCNKREKKEQ